MVSIHEVQRVYMRHTAQLVLMDTVRLLYMRYGGYISDTISMHYVHGVKYEVQWA